MNKAESKVLSPKSKVIGKGDSACQMSPESNLLAQRLANILSAPTLWILAIPHLPFPRREFLRTTIARKKGVSIPRNGRLLTLVANEALKQKRAQRNQLRTSLPLQAPEQSIEMSGSTALMQAEKFDSRKTRSCPRLSSPDFNGAQEKGNL